MMAKQMLALGWENVIDLAVLFDFDFFSEPQMTGYVSSDAIRSTFANAMSEMYRDEVPAYGELVSIVEAVNSNVLSADGNEQLCLDPDEDLERISGERHGAIRVGTPQELAMIRRVFAIMGMYPVGYYDLGASGIPVHSTAFRPTDRDALAKNPFRVFTSLLRLDLIDDDDLRNAAADILGNRNIFTENAITLTEKAEGNGGLEAEDANLFVGEVLETFRWAKDAHIDKTTYDKLHATHRLIADVVGFRGPHINHLTPRTLDIDAAQANMIAEGLPAKAIVEGPPPRDCPILLRQTSFKALEEAVRFVGELEDGHHTARFGEIEQRGVALTPKGRELYDRLLSDVRAAVAPAPDGSNAAEYVNALKKIFLAFPDSWRELHDQKLAYFRYKAVTKTAANHSIDILLDRGALEINPIIYEDFLPVSAAGIFQSNLGDNSASTSPADANRAEFENALGSTTADEFALYEAIQDHSLESALAILNGADIV